jgi:hypothetical protein
MQTKICEYGVRGVSKEGINFMQNNKTCSNTPKFWKKPVHGKRKLKNYAMC